MRIVLGLLLGLLCLTATGLADGYRNPPEGAAAIGRGGVRYAYADDASAVTHNPAALTDLRGMTFTPSLALAYARPEFRPLVGDVAQADASLAVIGALYLAAPIGDGRTVVGLGVHSPFGQSTSWNPDGRLGGLVPHEASLLTVNVSPALAVALTDALSVGVGLDAMWSRIAFRQRFRPPPGVPLGPFELDFVADGYGLGAHAGLVIDLHPRHRLALMYRSAVRNDVEGDFEGIDVPAALAPPGFTPQSVFKTTLNYPAIAALAYGVRLGASWRLEANVEWVEHSRNDVLALDIGANTPLLEAFLGVAELPQRWQNVWTWALGADWRYTENLTLRAGWTWLPTPVPDETFSPVLVDGDRHIMGIGAGWRAGGHVVDIAYAYSIMEARELDGAYGPLAGVYEAVPHLAALTYSYVF